MTWLWINIPFMVLTLALALGPLVYAIVTDTDSAAAPTAPGQRGEPTQAGRGPERCEEPAPGELVGAGRGGGWH